MESDTPSDSHSTQLATRPGRALAYHAVTGGYILAEVVKRATGKDMRELMEEKISHPLGLHWLRYGIEPSELDLTNPP